MRSRGVMIASLAMALAISEAESHRPSANVAPDPREPDPPPPDRKYRQRAIDQHPLPERAFKRYEPAPLNKSREAARRVRQMERAASKKAQRGFIDFGPAFVVCFIAGILVGLALPWIFRLLCFLVIGLAGLIS